MRGSKAVGITSEGLEIKREDGHPAFLAADSIVIATGSVSENKLCNEIKQLVSEVYTVGDAKEPRNALDAVREGFLAGMRI